MQVTVVCDNCQKAYAADASLAGRRMRCRGCGNIVTVPHQSGAPGAGEGESADGPDLDALAQVERSFAGSDALAAAHASTRVQQAVGPNQADQSNLPTGMEDVPLSGEGIEQAGRANLRFNFAGSKELDLIAPWLLVVGSLIWLFGHSSRTNRTDAGWITLTAAVAWIGFYAGLIWPITFAMIKQAGKTVGFQLPRTARFRTFASYMPALVLTATLWMLGHGAIASALMGALGGLLVASCCVWILFRLRPEEVPVTAGLGATGYLLGVVLSGALLFGLNALARSIADATGTTAIPMSPFGAGFVWSPINSAAAIEAEARARTRTVRAERADPKVIAPPVVETGPSGPPPVTPQLAATVTSAAAAVITDILPRGPVVDVGPQIAAPTSPLVASFSPASAMRLPADKFIFALTPSPFVATMQRNAGLVSFVCWDSRTWKRVNPQPVSIKAAQGNDDFVLSADGARLARTATFLRREIEIYSFATPNRAPETIPLNESAEGMHKLLGFLPAEPDAAPPKNERIVITADTAGKILANAFDLVKKLPVRLKPLELPPPEGGRSMMVLTAKARYFAMVGQHSDRRVPAVRFFSMNAERMVSSHEIPITGLPSNWSTVPMGFAVTTDTTAETDTLAAVLFEHPGGAIVYAFKQGSESKAGEFVDRNGQLARRSTGYTGPALLWVGSGKNRCLLVYGTTLLDLTRGEVIGQIDLPGIKDVALIDATTLLITSESDRHPIAARLELKLDGSVGAR